VRIGFEGGSNTDSVKGTAAFPSEFRAVTVKLYSPVTVGVPEIAPVRVSIETPVGNAPAVTEYVAAGKASAKTPSR
jgi:hypothetical protein